jgi:hypothetical protein
MADIARESDAVDPRVDFGHLSDPLKGSVLTPVIDEQDLELGRELTKDPN